MNKKLIIENDPTLRLVINIHLDIMNLSIEKKYESMEIVEMYTKSYTIDSTSELDKIFEEFYIEYLRKRDIELFFKQEFEDTELIKFPEEPEEED